MYAQNYPKLVLPLLVDFVVAVAVGIGIVVAVVGVAVVDVVDVVGVVDEIVGVVDEIVVDGVAVVEVLKIFRYLVIDEVY